MSIILGIDPGSRITGFGVIRVTGQEQAYIDCGCIRLGEGSMPQRLQVLFENLNTIIERYRPDQLSIEQVFLAKNASSALTLGHARGVAILAATNQGLEVYEYTAKQIKRSVVGTGAAAKSQVQHMVKLLLKLPSEPKEDAADALAAALCHARLDKTAHLLGQTNMNIKDGRVTVR